MALPVTESVLDRTRAMLDPAVFAVRGSTQPPPLLARAARYLQARGECYAAWGGVRGIYLTGSILSYQWTNRSDIDVKVVLVPTSPAALQTAIDDTWAQHGRHILPGTDHPVDLFILSPEDWTQRSGLFSGVFDVLRNRWVRGPYSVSADVDEYLERFEGTLHRLDLARAELSRDVLDYQSLQGLAPAELAELSEVADGKLREINQTVRQLVATYAVAHRWRDIALRGPTPGQIARATQDQLAPAAVLYKLLERYHYIQLLKQLRALLRETGGSIRGPEDVHDVWQALRSPVGEMTGVAAVGGVDVPLGLPSPAKRLGKRKRRRKKRRQPPTGLE